MAHLIAQSAVQPGVGTALGKVGGSKRRVCSAMFHVLCLVHLLFMLPTRPFFYPAAQICQCAPVAPDFRVWDLGAREVLGSSQGGRASQQITYQVRGWLSMGGRAEHFKVLHLSELEDER